MQISRWLADCKKIYTKFDDLEADLAALYMRNRLEFGETITKLGSPESGKLGTPDSKGTKSSPYRSARKSAL